MPAPDCSAGAARWLGLVPTGAAGKFVSRQPGREGTIGPMVRRALSPYASRALRPVGNGRSSPTGLVPWLPWRPRCSGWVEPGSRRGCGAVASTCVSPPPYSGNEPCACRPGAHDRRDVRLAVVQGSLTPTGAPHADGPQARHLPATQATSPGRSQRRWPGEPRALRAFRRPGLEVLANLRPGLNRPMRSRQSTGC